MLEGLNPDSKSSLLSIYGKETERMTCFIRYLPLKSAKWDTNLRMRAQSAPKAMESAKRTRSSDVPATGELTGSVQAVKLITPCVRWAPQQSRLQANGFWLCSQANANTPWSQNHRMVPSCPPLQLSKDWKNPSCETFSQVIKRYSGFPVLHVTWRCHTVWTVSMEHKLHSQLAAAGGTVNRGAERSKGGYIFNFLAETWLISPRFTQYCICIFHQPQNRFLFFLITD